MHQEIHRPQLTEETCEDCPRSWLLCQQKAQGWRVLSCEKRGTRWGGCFQPNHCWSTLKYFSLVLCYFLEYYLHSLFLLTYWNWYLIFVLDTILLYCFSLAKYILMLYMRGIYFRTETHVMWTDELRRAWVWQICKVQEPVRIGSRWVVCFCPFFCFVYFVTGGRPLPWSCYCISWLLFLAKVGSLIMMRSCVLERLTKVI